MEKYRNPANGHTETITRWTWLWATLFGPFFFASRGVWPHFFLAWLTWPWGAVGLACLAAVPIAIATRDWEAFFRMAPGLPLLALMLLHSYKTRSILRSHYGRRGWIAVDSSDRRA